MLLGGGWNAAVDKIIWPAVGTRVRTCDWAG